MVRGYRRIFAHTASIFFQRDIARPETAEISSLSCEPCQGQEIVVSLFDIPVNENSVHAFIEREHEFKLVAVQTWTLHNDPNSCLSVSLKAQNSIPACNVWSLGFLKHSTDKISLQIRCA